LLKENKKLEKFDLKEINLSEDKLTLNKNIENVINESVFKKVTNVNRLHESVNFLIESLTRKEEQKLVKTDKKFNVNNIFLLAKKKLEEKFTNMDDSELEVFLISLWVMKIKKEPYLKIIKKVQKFLVKRKR
jgi:hypothetical protein